MRNNKTAQVLAILAFFIFINLPAYAYNIEVIPQKFDETLLPNEVANISFKITNRENQTFNITFRTANKLLANFSKQFFALSQNQFEQITATIKPIEEEGEYNDTISIVNNINMTTEGLMEIPLNIYVGTRIKAEFYMKKCFIDNNTEYCNRINITEIQNITIINQTNVTEQLNIMIPFNVYQEWVDKTEKRQEEIKEAIVNASKVLAGEHIKEEIDYKNALIVKNILRNSMDVWMELKPNNILQNLTTMTDKELFYAIQYLENNGEATRRTVRENLAYTYVGPPDYLPKNYIMITQIGLTDRINTESTWFLAQITIGVTIIMIVLIFIGVKISNMRIKTTGW